MRRKVFVNTGYFLALLRKRDSSAVNFVEKIRSDPNTTVVSFGPEGMSKAFTFYKERPDKEWGLVDCFSFVTMKENRTRLR